MGRPGAGGAVRFFGWLLPAAVAVRRARARGLVRGAVRGSRPGRRARRDRERRRLVGLARTGRGRSPGRTSTRCWTGARTTGRSAWSPRSRRSTCCVRGDSRRRGRSGSRCSWRRRGRGSGWRAWARGWRLARCRGSVARELRDRDGVFLADGSRLRVCPARRIAPLLEGVETFVELHVEQGRDLVDRSAAVGVASGIWPHGRYRYEFRGAADHAGTTRMEDRADPMLTYAMTALAANKQARLAGQRATFGRLEVTPELDQLRALAVSRPGWTRGRRPPPPWRSWWRRRATGLGAGVARRHRAGGDAGVGVGCGRLLAGPRRAAGRAAGLAGHPDRRRPRRRHPLGRRHPHRDALRPQPDGGVPLARGDGLDGGLPCRGRRPWPTCSPSLAGDPA